MCLARPRPAARPNSPHGASAQDERSSRRSAALIPSPGQPEKGAIIGIAAEISARPFHEAEAKAAPAAGE